MADFFGNAYPVGFFITENDEIVYSTGYAHPISTYATVVRILENIGPMEGYESFDGMTPASNEEAKKFYRALCEYVNIQKEFYQDKIRKLQSMLVDWKSRVDDL